MSGLKKWALLFAQRAFRGIAQASVFIAKFSYEVAGFCMRRVDQIEALIEA